MQKQFLALLLGLVPLLGFADVVTESQAEATAERFFNGGDSHVTRMSAKSPLKLVYTSQLTATRGGIQEAPAFYVYNRGVNDGFVVVSGESSVKPILAYASEGSFCVEGMPENLKAWMNHKQYEILSARRKQVEPSSEVKQAWDTMVASESVVELGTPLWNQNAPYNDMTPNNYYTGCTITATAIVMGYYQWPDKVEGELPSYTEGGVTWPGLKLGHEYKWSDMPYIYGNELDMYNQNQRKAVATLMRDLGVMGHANYMPNSTQAWLSEMARGLPKYMKYNPGLLFVEGKYFPWSTWADMLQKEIGAGRPVIFTGYGDKGGHTFVLDGYDSEGRFYVNWGWSGQSNGFFSIDNLDPKHQGAGGNSAGYNDNQQAIMHMIPNKPGFELAPLEYMTYIYEEDQNITAGVQTPYLYQPIVDGMEFVVSVATLKNMGTQSYTGKFKLAITTPNGNIKKELYTSPEFTLKPGTGVRPLKEIGNEFKVKLTEKLDGGDRIRLLYLSANGLWLPVTSKADRFDLAWEILLKEGEPSQPDPVPQPKPDPDPDPEPQPEPEPEPQPLVIEVSTRGSINLDTCAVAVFSAEVATTPSDPSVEVYYAEVKNARTIRMKKMESADNKLVVPANTGVILVTRESTKFTMEETEETVDVIPASNVLRASIKEGTTVDPELNAYKLMFRLDKVMFYAMQKPNDRKMGANTCYLVMPDNMASSVVNMQFGEDMTGIYEYPLTPEIDPDAPVYDVTGKMVDWDRLMRGSVYIQNGHKFMKE